MAPRIPAMKQTASAAAIKPFLENRPGPTSLLRILVMAILCLLAMGFKHP